MAFLSLIGGIVGAIGSIASANAQANAAEYQAAVARNNKIIADQNATYERQTGQVEEQAVRLKTAETISAAHAIQGASGVESESGSPVQVRKTTAIVGEEDALNTYTNAQRRAYEYVVQGTNFEAQAKLYDYQAGAERMAGFFNAFSSILGGISSVAGKWSGMAFGGSGSVSSGGEVSTPLAGPTYYPPSTPKAPAYYQTPTGGGTISVYSPSGWAQYRPASNVSTAYSP